MLIFLRLYAYGVADEEFSMEVCRILMETLAKSLSTGITLIELCGVTPASMPLIGIPHASTPAYEPNEYVNPGISDSASGIRPVISPIFTSA